MSEILFRQTLNKEVEMLVLSRKVGESIIIDGNILIKITQVRGDKVRIGIEAPQSVRIIREELADDPRELLQNLQGS